MTIRCSLSNSPCKWWNSRQAYDFERPYADAGCPTLSTGELEDSTNCHRRRPLIHLGLREEGGFVGCMTTERETDPDISVHDLKI